MELFKDKKLAESFGLYRKLTDQEIKNIKNDIKENMEDFNEEIVSLIRKIDAICKYLNICESYKFIPCDNEFGFQRLYTGMKKVDDAAIKEEVDYLNAQ